MLKTITPVYNSSYVFEELPAGTQFLITIYAVGKTRQDGKIKQLGSPGATAVGVTSKDNKKMYLQLEAISPIGLKPALVRCNQSNWVKACFDRFF